MRSLFDNPYGFGRFQRPATSERYRRTTNKHAAPASRVGTTEQLQRESLRPRRQASLTNIQKIRLYNDLNDQYVALTGRELPSPSSLEGWSARDIQAYFNSNGHTLPRHLLSPQSPRTPQPAPVGRMTPRRPRIDPATAAVKIQSVLRGWMVRRLNVSAALKRRKIELDGIVCAAVEATNRFEPWVFDLALESKKVAGVPVPLIEYEETLLRQQLKLDGLQSCGPTADIMRHWRRQANSRLQERLNEVDACREEWRRVEAANVA